MRDIIDKNQITPMMRKYLETKEQYEDAVLLYRLGDFYEMFFDDAELCSRVLGITLTGKDCGLEKRAPMCGIPYHAADNYIQKLVTAGYKVAVCEQLSLPMKGIKLVDRDVVRVITPGTVIDSNMVKEDRNNFLVSLYKSKDNIGISYIDISTGDFYVCEFNGTDVLTKVNDTLIRIKPSEIICNAEMKKCDDLPCLKGKYVPDFEVYGDSNFSFETCEAILKKQLNTNNLRDYGIANKTYAIIAAGSVLAYIKETQKRDLNHINNLKYETHDEYMQIDGNTRRNLEISETTKDRRKYGSLLWLLDKTKTKMGQRTLTQMIEQPLFNLNKINYRQKAVEELCKNIIARENIGQILYNIYDIERLCGKISYNNINPKDCVSLKNSLRLLPDLKKVLDGFSSQAIVDLRENIYSFDEIVTLIDNAIDEEKATSTLKDYGFIKKGYNAELDELNDISTSGKNWILQIEAKEKERTNIKNLKVAYNRVFGYYIEVPNTQKDLVPFNYIRKQTLVNAERYITDELKTIEEKILHAEENRISIEQKLFAELRESLLNFITPLQKTSQAIAFLDALLSLAVVATERNYVKPILSKNIDSIEIIGGRHPIVEAINKDEDFVPNDTMLNSSDSRVMIITGPNMAGKSTYMRQVALITYMAHIGSFVPATSAKISLTDRIFTRVGASDDLSFGQSTFMVEMSEVSNIVKNATDKSLIVLDEVGRGTSTFDGLSIAWSVVEYISKNLNAKTLFATHYHELTDLEGTLDGVKNYRVSIKEYNNSIIFLRKIVRGGANRSFGIEVASLAGLPQAIIDRARTILHNLEENDLNKSPITTLDNSNTKKDMRAQNEIIGILRDTDLNSLTPLSAFDILVQLKGYLKE